jgi:hypothetical protein
MPTVYDLPPFVNPNFPGAVTTVTFASAGFGFAAFAGFAGAPGGAAAAAAVRCGSAARQQAITNNPTVVLIM